MKASELRIGNWVDIKSFNGNQGIVRTQFNYDLLYIYLCEPIPLTPEILEKCTLIIKIDSVEYRIGRLTLHLVEYEHKYIMNVFLHSSLLCIIDYLHQLQNLIYALTGEELEFKP